MNCCPGDQKNLFTSCKIPARMKKDISSRRQIPCASCCQPCWSLLGRPEHWWSSANVPVAAAVLVAQSQDAPFLLTEAGLSDVRRDLGARRRLYHPRLPGALRRSFPTSLQRLRRHYDSHPQQDRLAGASGSCASIGS